MVLTSSSYYRIGDIGCLALIGRVGVYGTAYWEASQ